MKGSSGDDLAAIRERAKAHLQRYLESGGADGGTVGGLPALILSTVGRKSGLPRQTPLFFGRDGDRFIVVASVAGLDTHPGWYLNLVAHPDAEVQIQADRFRVRAREAVEAERDRLWRLMTDIFPRYQEYDDRTTREIPVVVLEPVRHETS